MALTSLELSAAIIRAPIVVSPKMPVLAAIAQMGRAHSDPLVAEAERDSQPGAADRLIDLPYQVKVDCVLVVEAGRVVGILTTQDVLRLTSQQRPLTSLLIEQVMTQPVVTLREADFTELSVAMELFREKRIRHLPILDGQDRLVGLATPESLRRVAMMTERQKTEAQLRACEQRYASLLAAAPIGIFRADATGQVIYVNDRWFQITGLGPEAIWEDAWVQGLHPDDRGQVVTEWRLSIQERRPFQLEYRYQRPDGAVSWVHGQSVVERDADGEVIGYVGTLTDLSDYKRAETALQNLIEGTAAATGQDFFPALVSHIAETLSVAYALVTERVGDMLHTLAFWGNGALQPPFSCLLAKMPCERTLQDGVFYCEHSLLRQFPQQPNLIAMEAESYLGVALRNGRGDVIGSLCILNQHPIPDLHRAEQILRVFAARAAAELERQRADVLLKQLNQALEAKVEERTSELRANEAQLRAMMDSIPDLLLRVTRDGTCLDYILSPNQLGEFLPIQRHLSETLPPDLLKKQLDSIEQAIASNTVQVYEHQFPKHNRMTYEEVRVSAISSEQALIMVRDITERKRAEEALQVSETKSRIILAAIPDLMFRVGADGVYRELVTLNPEIDLFFGGRDPVGAPMEAILPAEIAAGHLRHLEQALRTGQLQIYEQQVQVHGQRRYDEVRAVKSSDDEVLFMIRDITDRKQAEQQLQQLNQQLEARVEERTAALKEREARYYALMNGASDAILLADQQGNLLEANDKAEELLGYARAELTAMHYSQLYRPEEVSRILAATEELVNQKFVQVLDIDCLGKEGQSIPVDLSASVVEINGETIIQGIFRDITERKQAERERQQLFQELSDFKFALDQSAIVDITDADRVITYVNDRFCETSGYSKDEIIGRTHRLVNANYHPPMFFQNLWSTLASGHTWRGEICHRTKQGHLYWVESTFVPFLDHQGKPVQYLGIRFDITPRKLAEAAIQQENAFRQQLVENMGEGVCVCQEVEAFPFFRFSVWNRQMQVITGYTLEEINRLGWYQSLYPDPGVQAQAIARMQQMHRGDNLASEEWEIQRKDGQRRMFAISTSILANRNGQTWVLGLMQDITERKQAQQQLSERNQQLAVSNTELARVTRLKDEFLASMSHELRTPLNAILGMTEGLLEGVFGETNNEQSEALQTIERSSSHLLELINDILDLSKIESGQIELDYKPTAAAALCQSSLAFIKQQALKKRIQIEMQLPANLPDLLVDERHIRQALINLLNNAVKFTPEGGRITLTVSGPNLSDATNLPEGLSPNRLSITVADTGIGIPPDHIETIFQPFVQIDSALNRQYPGTGLGLALVERIVRLHGGDVDIISEVGVGSRFTINLPCTTSPPSSQGAELPSYSVIEPNQNQLKPAPIILLVEDNEASVSTISSYLRAKGYRLLVAKNGLEAIALTRSGNPDLILMDIQMPRMDGFEAIQKIRQDLNCADVPIIALTALAMTGDRERCLATGATDYLSKPVKLKRLTAIIQQLLTS